MPSIQKNGAKAPLSLAKPPTGAAVANTSAKTKEEKRIKYTDKSAGQQQLEEIFSSIKKMMEPYATGTIKEQDNYPGIYNLVSKKQVEIEGRKKAEVCFASIMIQKGFVGFYFMPVYMNKQADKMVQPALYQCLKGKACFHLKKNDPALMEQVKYALAAGYQLYKEKEWV